MTKGSPANLRKRNSLPAALDNEKLDDIRSKLSDKRYVYGAIYCLASIITDRVMDMGGDIDASEESSDSRT